MYKPLVNFFNLGFFLLDLFTYFYGNLIKSMSGIIIPHHKYNLEIHYDHNGLLSHVFCTQHKECLIIEIKTQGVGYEFTMVAYAIDNGNKSYVCDARYARIIKYNLYIPYRLFIQAPSISLNDDNE